MTSNSLFDLTGKTAVITGGNGGIGLGCARGLAASGANIAIWARNADKSAAAVGELSVLGVQARAYIVDVTSRSELERAVSATISDFGGIDILIANAGLNIRMRPEELSDEIVDQMMIVFIQRAMKCDAIRTIE